MDDNSLSFVGYQAHFADPSQGLFLFNHNEEGCFTTIAIKAAFFAHLSRNPMAFKEFKPHGEGCPGNCSDHSNLEDCNNVSCPGREIRALIQEIQKHLASHKPQGK